MTNNNKKGISLLLSTILIIALIVFLSILVFWWGRTYIENLTENAGERTEEKLLCLQEISFKISSLCYGSANGIIRIGIDNMGKREITGVIFRIRYLDGSADVILDESIKLGKLPIKEADLEIFEINYDKTKDLKEIEVIPISIYNQVKEVTCTESSETEQIYTEC